MLGYKETPCFCDSCTDTFRLLALFIVSGQKDTIFLEQAHLVNIYLPYDLDIYIEQGTVVITCDGPA